MAAFGKTWLRRRREARRFNRLFVVMLTVIVGGTFWSFYPSAHFVPSSGLSRDAATVAKVLTFATVLVVIYMKLTGRWSPSKRRNEYSWFGKVIIPAFGISMWFSMLWLTLSVPLPHLFTEMFGWDAKQRAVLYKQRGSSRRARCRYSLTRRELSSLRFEWCISKSRFDALPDAGVELTLTVRKSRYGYVVKDVTFPDW